MKSAFRMQKQAQMQNQTNARKPQPGPSQVDVSSQLTKASDVYSFGIIMIEVFRCVAGDCNQLWAHGMDPVDLQHIRIQ